MKTWSTILAVMIALMLSVSIAEAAKGAKGAKAGRPTPGTIAKIDGNTLTITPRAKKNSTETPADITVTADDNTEVTINGEKKTLADLKVGDKVRVTLGEDGKATLIASGKAAHKAEAPTTQAGN